MSVPFQKVQGLQLLLDVIAQFDRIFNLLGISQPAFALEHFVASVSEILVSLGIISSHEEQFFVEKSDSAFERLCGCHGGRLSRDGVCVT